MRNGLVLLAAGFLIGGLAAFAIFTLLSTSDEPSPDRVTGPVDAEGLVVTDIRRALASLEAGVVELSARTDRLEGRFSASAEDVNGDLVARIMELEDAIAQLQSSPIAEFERRRELRQSREALASGFGDAVGHSGYRPNASAAALYEADAGEPITDYVDALSSELFTSEDLIRIEDFTCLESVCRLVYSPGADNLESSSGSDDSALFDRVASGLGGRDFDARFEVDARGNRVMYIQLSE